jgi:2-(1,2-epoxy-1,2-dihydrophenyl)acetyl-CoA isomerase
MEETVDELARVVYASLRTGDRASLAGVLAPGFVAHFAEGMPAGGGRAEGPDEAIEHWWAMGRMFSVSAEPEEFAPLVDGRLMVRGRYLGRRRDGGGTVDAEFIHLWRASDGRLCELRQLTDTVRW